MTLQEHLEEIARGMAANGANKTEILLFQLYLVCAAKEGYLGEYAKQAKYEDPFDQVLPVLGDIWFKVDSDALNSFYEDDEIEFLPLDIPQSVFNELLNRAARDGGAYFDHLQPKELSSIVAKLCGETEGKSIYNPYAGVGSYAESFCAGDSYHGEEYDPYTWAIGVLKAWMEGYLSCNYVRGDSLSPDWKTRFDIIVSTPPIGRVPNGKETYSERLAATAPELLNPGGTLVMVASMGNLIGPRKRALLKTGMLDLVVILPQNVFYWTPIAPVVIRLRSGRRPDEPVTLVDGTSFSLPGGRHTRIIDEGALLQAINDKNPAYAVTRLAGELESNEYGLNPALYISEQQAVGKDGQKMVPLRDLGSFLKLPVYGMDDDGQDALPDAAITIGDLTSDPCLADVEPHALEKRIGRFRVLSQPALLVYAIPNKVRVGYAHASADNPVCIQDRIHAFVPDENVVSIRYLAYALTGAEIASRGASVFLVTRDDLLLTRIPLVPRAEQDILIRNDQALFLKDEDKEIHPSRTIKKPAVVFIGSHSSIADILVKSLRILKDFKTPSDAEAWVTNNQKKLDAIVINYSDGMDAFDIVDLCKTGIPVFFLTADMRSFENLLGKRSEQYLKNHSFAIGSEVDLVKQLIQEVAERKTPEWLVRQRFASELEAVGSIDNRFPDKGYSARSIIEDMLLSEEARSDWRNQLRTIRTDCVLKPLVDYGFLPAIQAGSFNLGAQIDLLADRVYSPNNQQYRLFLIREVLPSEIAEMLQGSKRLLNEGSHSIGTVDRNVQRATLFSILAALCHIAAMIDKGLFDRCEPERIRSIYQVIYREDEYVTGIHSVMCRRRPDHSDYYYAGNIHLDDSMCRKLQIRQGDQVDISSAIREKSPVITDSVCIAFYSNSFVKIS